MTSTTSGKAKVDRLSVRAAVVKIQERPGSGREAQGGLQGARGLALQLAYGKQFAGGVPLASGLSAADSVAALSFLNIHLALVGSASPAALCAHAREQAQDITQSHTNPTPIGHQTTLYHINPTLHYTSFDFNMQLLRL